MRAQLLHLSGPGRGRTVTYAVPRVTIGSDPTSTAYLRDPNVAIEHARIDWEQDACVFHLHALEGEVFVNGNQVREVILQDEDEIEFGVDGPRARFRTYVPQGAVCKPVRRMLADARAVARESGGRAATETLTRDLFTQATLTLKVGFPILVIALALLAGWFGGWLSSRPYFEARHTADEYTRAEIDELREWQQAREATLESLARGNATLKRVREEWRKGVCLVHGVYRLRQPDKTWWLLGGKPFEAEYTGSGFLVSRAGHIVTNRHVAVPWSEVGPLQPLIAQGYVPEFVRFTVTFPGLPAITVPPESVKTRTDDQDVAVLQVAAEAVTAVPVLPLATETRNDYERAIVVGYPTGLAALLARADTALVERLQQKHASMAVAIDELAAAGQIQPVITRGSVTVEERLVTYDAATTHGGSGGPVFSGTGEVIAVNFAIQKGFHGLNYGVPVQFARELLPR
ncbi:MAG: trypsin-like peptidase domain-containing protein [bacterium]|nr:trypsin-like peptidase domain-containing protein [bacterium]